MNMEEQIALLAESDPYAARLFKAVIDEQDEVQKQRRFEEAVFLIQRRDEFKRSDERKDHAERWINKWTRLHEVR